MLTGEVRYRLGFGKKLILQVQYKTRRSYQSLGESVDLGWRDAKVEDIRALTILQERSSK